MKLRAVGIRDLKDRLSEYLRLVRAGERILVTDHGEVVAELREPSPLQERSGVPPGLLELVRDAKASLGAENRPDAYPSRERVVPDGTSRELLEEERGEE